MELTEYGAQDIWNQNKPDEVRSKYNLSELIRMLKEENGGNSIFFCQSSLLRFRRRKEGKRVAWSRWCGSWGPAFPLAAEPRTTAMDLSPHQTEIVNARDAIVAEPLSSPDAATSPSSQLKVINVLDGTPMSAKSEVAIAGAPIKFSILPSNFQQVDRTSRLRKRRRLAPSGSFALMAPR